jgi:glyoxylase-like metal-dependent hydrolase (beta-lactamase superfamily II)
VIAGGQDHDAPSFLALPMFPRNRSQCGWNGLEVRAMNIEVTRRKFMRGGANLAGLTFGAFSVGQIGSIPATSMEQPTADSLPLRWKVYTSNEIPVIMNEIPPGQTVRSWPPTTSTLVFGGRDAVLVDALFTAEQARHLLEWVAQSGKALTAIYITHPHGDHYLGAGTILQRFPAARVVALPQVARQIRQQGSAEDFRRHWESLFPGQVPADVVVAEDLVGDTLHLEGHDLIAVHAGTTDTSNTTFLHVPSISLVIAGDVVYNDVHVHLSESTHATRREWIAALDRIESLRPRAVIAGHKRLGAEDDPRNVGETRRYIRDFDRLVGTTSSERELYERMLELYPHRINRGALWSSALAAKR